VANESDEAIKADKVKDELNERVVANKAVDELD
jgi:hypothetical protein